VLVFMVVYMAVAMKGLLAAADSAAATALVYL
jgi:hypothetical protein